MNIHLSRPDVGELEIEAVCRVLRSPNLSLGPELEAFEQAFCQRLGVKRAVAVSSGTAALFLCLKAMGIGEGDEVITTPFTFISSATSILMAGARPVFVDIDPETLNLDPSRIEGRINSKTKAILPVEVFGNPSHMKAYQRIARARQILMIEDSCEALGSTLDGQPAGTFGHAGTFAFYPNKQITTGEGGMIVTNNDSWADLCVSLRNQGRSPQGGWLAHERLGYNFRLSDINCALGRIQLSRLEEFKGKRRRVAQTYLEHLASDERVIAPRIPDSIDMSWFVFVIRLQDQFGQSQRNQLLDIMRQQGIQVSNYFPPVHLQPFIAEQLNHHPGDFPITEQVAERTIALPFHNAITEPQIHQVCNALSRGLDQLTK